MTGGNTTETRFQAWHTGREIMKCFTIVTGMCIVLVIATIFVAGCTSSSNAPVTGTGASPGGYPDDQPAPTGSSTSPQLTETIVAAPASGQGALADNAGDADTDAATISANAAVDPYNSTSQPTTMVPDSADIGDPIP